MCVIVPTVRNEPFPPQNVISSNVTADSAKISWTVPIIASTQEIYEVLYGINTANNNVSVAQHSQPGVEEYDVILNSLLPSTRYRYIVQATNDNSSSSSEEMRFTTEPGYCLQL